MNYKDAFELLTKEQQWKVEDNYNNQNEGSRFEHFLLQDSNTPRRVIDMAFTWEYTEEWDDYWNDLMWELQTLVEEKQEELDKENFIEWQENA